MMAFIIKHKEWGIYLGSALGLGFWSVLDPVGQEYAVTFDKEELAEKHLDSWDDTPNKDDVEYIKIIPDIEGAISREACRAQGVGYWVLDS